MKVVLVPCDSTWSEVFTRESEEVAGAFGSCLTAIHHIGSTAIPGIHAKPIIDVLAEVTAVEEADEHSGDMVKLGYEVMGEYGIPGRRYYRKNDQAGVRRFHVHAFRTASAEVRRHLAFRDFLREHPQHAEEYSRLKRSLVEQQRCDSERYVAGKDAFIKDMQRRALSWQEGKK